jgi:hypothetical protein
MLQKLPPGENKSARGEPSQIKIMRSNLQKIVRDKSPKINSLLLIGPFSTLQKHQNTFFNQSPLQNPIIR